MTQKKIYTSIFLSICIYIFSAQSLFASSIENFLNPKNLQINSPTIKDEDTPFTQEPKTPIKKKEDIKEPPTIITTPPKWNLNIPTLMFHYIDNQEPSQKMRYRISFPPEKFEKLLQYLNKNNIETLTFFDIEDILQWKKAMPEKAIMLTFDDGYYSQYENAFSLLKKYNKNWVFFIIASKPESDPDYMGWEEIREIEAAGNEIGSHTITHPNLTKLSPQLQKREIISSKNLIEYKIKNPIISFSYPYGGYNADVINTVKGSYHFARNIEHGVSFSTDSLYSIHTIHTFPEFNIESIGKYYQ